jgi:hypothetical protein
VTAMPGWRSRHPKCGSVASCETPAAVWNCCKPTSRILGHRTSSCDAAKPTFLYGVKMNQPMFSIVIPTTRPHYLQYSLASVLAQSFVDFEVIVAINRDSNIARSAFQIPDDPRIRVLEADRFLVMYENWENGIKLATGRWRMLLGDDDCLVPQALELIAQQLRHQPEIECLVWQWGGYFAPGWSKSNPRGSASLPSFTGQITARSAAELARLIFSFDPDRMSETKRWLPSIMRAAVRSDIVVEAINRAGAFCLPFSPDYGGAVHVLGLASAIHLFDVPLVILNTTADSQAAGIEGRSDVRKTHFWDLIGNEPFRYTLVQTRYESNRPVVCETLMRGREYYPELAKITPFCPVDFLNWHYDGLLQTAKRGVDIAVPLAELERSINDLPTEQQSHIRHKMEQRVEKQAGPGLGTRLLKRAWREVAAAKSRILRQTKGGSIHLIGTHPHAQSILKFSQYCGDVIVQRIAK